MEIVKSDPVTYTIHTVSKIYTSFKPSSLKMAPTLGTVGETYIPRIGSGTMSLGPALGSTSPHIFLMISSNKPMVFLTYTVAQTFSNTSTLYYPSWTWSHCFPLHSTWVYWGICWGDCGCFCWYHPLSLDTSLKYF